jgi:predicted enzyme related to lactoylglutathione lyase
MAGKLVHFEIPADDTSRALDFDRRMFGWSFQAMEGPVEYHMTQVDEGLGGPVHAANGLVRTVQRHRGQPVRAVAERH